MEVQSALLLAYAEHHADEVGLALQQADAGAAAEVLSMLPASTAAEVLPHLAPVRAARVLEQMPIESAADVVRASRPDRAALILYRVEPKCLASILEALPGRTATMLKRVLAFPPNSAAALADSGVLTLTPRETVAEALARLRLDIEHVAYYLYLLDDDGRPVGAVTLRELLAADPQAVVATVATMELEILPAATPVDLVEKHPAWLRYHALPVVDGRGRFVGMVHHKTLRDAETRARGRDDASSTASALAELFGIGALAGFSWAGGAATDSDGKLRVP